MPGQPSLPSEDDLKKLPRRAVVAYAVRCARRVQPVYGRAARIEEFARHAATVELALSVAEQFCLGDEATTAGQYSGAVRVAAASLADAAAEAAADAEANCAARAAAYAARAACFDADIVATQTVFYAARAAAAADRCSAAVAYVKADYDRLLELKLGTHPDRGEPIDPTENGPLGPLWPEGAPEWFNNAAALQSQSGPRFTVEAELLTDPN